MWVVGGHRGTGRDSAWLWHWEGEIRGGIYVGEGIEGGGLDGTWTRRGTRVVSLTYGFFIRNMRA